ncbi:MAG: ATP-binding cassette domain-containing protein, partial [Candidatus Eiseniibacteriota bacterium]
MSVPAVEVIGLTRVFEQFVAVDHINLRVESGTVFGFLGPNGAGKTTTIRCVMGMIRPTSGSAHVLGLDCLRDPVEVKRRVGYLPG